MVSTLALRHPSPLAHPDHPLLPWIVYEDTLPGLAELAKNGIVVTLSNGNYRLLVDMVSRPASPGVVGLVETERRPREPTI